MRNFVMFISMVVLICGFMPVMSHAEGMSVAQAYKMQRSKQTTFDKSIAKMDAEDSKYLDHLFFVTDLAFRERMMMLSLFQSYKDDMYIDKYNEEIGSLLASFEFIKPPTRNLQNVQDMVISAILDQQDFFNEWHKAKQGTSYYNKLIKDYARHPKVQSSHQKLLRAYGMLKSTYPAEGRHNMQSFYDHLCALDFI